MSAETEVHRDPEMWAIECPECGGSGQVEVEVAYLMTCWVCEGIGLVDIDVAEQYYPEDDDE